MPFDSLNLPRFVLQLINSNWCGVTQRWPSERYIYIYTKKWLPSAMAMTPYGRIQLQGRPIQLTSRDDLSAAAQKHIMKHTYTIVCDGDKGYQHEIANHYRDYRQLVATNAAKSSSLTTVGAQATGKNRKQRHRKRVEVRNRCNQRELLQIPCFAFPRYGFF